MMMMMIYQPLLYSDASSVCHHLIWGLYFVIGLHSRAGTNYDNQEPEGNELRRCTIPEYMHTSVMGVCASDMHARSLDISWEVSSHHRRLGGCSASEEKLEA